MSLRFWILSIKYRRLISTSQFKNIINAYTKMINDIMTRAIDYADKDKDGYLSIAEIVYILSQMNKKMSKNVKAIE